MGGIAFNGTLLRMMRTPENYCMEDVTFLLFGEKLFLG